MRIADKLQKSAGIFEAELYTEKLEVVQIRKGGSDVLHARVTSLYMKKQGRDTAF
ncbi:MAG TPA: hypothetical protein PKO47_00980 [bacterium]|nr:hypothetical protein [bacterium]HNL25332.1 hypothetical protein [bacterium]HNO10800.1 hypothetical protein [bacterium]